MSAASFDVPRAGTSTSTLPVSRDEDFPGCESFPLPASELDRYEGRLEFWDGATGTAWKVCEPTSIQHEQPSRTSSRRWPDSIRNPAWLAHRVLSAPSDLVRLDAAGWQALADAGRRGAVPAPGPGAAARVRPSTWTRDPLPDVVLEVDHTTDVRRRKLGIYKESGFPEVWVLVPWESSVRSPGSRFTCAGGRDTGRKERAGRLRGGRRRRYTAR